MMVASGVFAAYCVQGRPPKGATIKYETTVVLLPIHLLCHRS